MLGTAGGRPSAPSLPQQRLSCPGCSTFGKPHSCRTPHTPGCHCAKSTFTFRAAGMGQADNSHPPSKEGMIGVSHLSFACIAAFLSCFGELMDDPALKSNGEKESPQGIYMDFQFPFQINSVEVHKTISLY